MASRRSSSYDSFPTGEPSRRSHRAAVPPSQSRDASSYSRSSYGSGGNAPRHAASSYSRSSSQGEYSRTRAKKSRTKKIVGTIVAVVLALTVGLGAAALVYVGMLNGKLTGDVGADLRGVLADVKAPTEPFYILLMGVDKSQQRSESAEYNGDNFRSDSMILARVDPKDKKMTLISIVRDTYVEIDGYGRNKINAAHALGGPALTVKTVSEFAGVPIAHYAEIDFDGFKAAVDALGGIDVNVPMEIDDVDAGGYVPAGEQTLNGDQALILCRARHAYDEIGAGDFYRAANQRMVMGAVAKKLLSADVGTIASTVTSLCDYIDTDMNVTDIIAVASAMRGMDTETNIYSSMNPTISTYEDGVWYEYSNNEAWRAMMKRVDAGETPTVDAADSANDGGVADGSISGEYVAQSVLGGGDGSATRANVEVEVRNGSGVSGVAADASSVLTNSGYDVTTVGDAESYNYTTTIVVYDSDGDAGTAQAIAQSLGGAQVIRNDGTYSVDGTYLVVVGSDY
ncbi:MAG: LCP family protein [Slackia sp.]|nr:LCP family protein [Slackia sp.]